MPWCTSEVSLVYAGAASQGFGWTGGLKPKNSAGVDNIRHAMPRLASSPSARCRETERGGGGGKRERERVRARAR